MHKYVFIALLILNISIHAMDDLIKLPSEQDLKNKLHAMDLDYFLQKTELDKKLADQQILLRAIVVKLDLAIIDYKKHFKEEALSALVYAILQKRKGAILRAILFNNPDAIKTLEDEHIIH